jgi:hypothetical protein
MRERYFGIRCPLGLEYSFSISILFFRFSVPLCRMLLRLSPGRLPWGQKGVENISKQKATVKGQ